MRPSEGRRGFSLAEVLAALAILGLLMAGMVRVLASGLRSVQEMNAALGARRGLRWAMDHLAEDLKMAGYRFPFLEFPGDSPPPLPVAIHASLPVRPLPGASAPRPDPGGEGKPCDQLTLLMDQPLDGGLELAASCGEGMDGGRPGSGILHILSERTLELRPGDFLVFADGRLEWVRVARGASLARRRAGAVEVMEEGAFRFRHPAGAALLAIRPGRVVRYRVARVPRPGRPGGAPCLIRMEAPFSQELWDEAGEGASPGAWGKARVLAEGVTGLQAEFLPGEPFPGMARIALEAGAGKGGGRRERQTLLVAGRQGGGRGCP
jgi:prepilin-type N-terminal cleavage/methylation domain-containing protein